MHLYSVALGWYRRTVVALVRAFAGGRWRLPQGAGTFAIRLVHIIKLAVCHGKRGGQGILHIQDSRFKILHLPAAAVARLAAGVGRTVVADLTTGGHQARGKLSPGGAPEDRQG